MEEFKLTVTLGDIVSSAVTLGGILLAYGALKERLSKIEVQLGPLVAWWNARAANANKRRLSDVD